MKDIFAGILLIIVVIFIEPLFVFGIGAFVGLIAKITIGNMLVCGLNSLLGTAFITKDLPLIAGTLAWVGSFFKTSVTSKREK